MSSSTDRRPSFQRQPSFLKTLGLAFPCTEPDVQEAYRQKVFAAHPDRGGTAAAFMAVEAAYPKALEYARFHSGRTQWLARSMQRYVDQQQLIDEIARLGGRVEIEPLDWLIDEIGEDFAQVLERIVAIDLSCTEVDDLTIELLVRSVDALEGLRRIDLSGTRVSDAGVRQLSAFAGLRELMLCETGVSGAALTLLNDLPDLERLSLRGSNVGWLARMQLGWSRPYLQVRSGRAERYTRASRVLFRAAAVAAALYLALTFTLTHLPPQTVPALPGWTGLGVDKFIHAAMYLGLGFVAAAVVGLASPRPQRLAAGVFALRLALLWIVLAGWALFDEASQPWIGRTFEWDDWLADVAGAAIGLALLPAALMILRWLAPSIWRLTKAEQSMLDHRRAMREMLVGQA